MSHWKALLYSFIVILKVSVFLGLGKRLLFYFMSCEVEQFFFLRCDTKLSSREFISRRISTALWWALIYFLHCACRQACHHLQWTRKTPLKQERKSWIKTMKVWYSNAYSLSLDQENSLNELMFTWRINFGLSAYTSHSLWGMYIWYWNTQETLQCSL